MKKDNNKHRVSQTILGTITFGGVFGSKPIQAKVPDFEQLLIFGDSLSDTGNVLNMTGGLLPNEPQFAPGRFSNDLVWVDYLAQEQGLNPLPYTSLPPLSSIPEDGINFAIGGARTDDTNVSPLGFPGLEQQLDTYEMLLNGEAANSKALHVLWAGANDYLGYYFEEPVPTAPPPPPTQPEETIANLENALRELAEAGAENILVPNLPDLGAIPLAASRGPDVVTTLSNLTQEHNSLLAGTLADFSQFYPDVNLISLDVNQLFEDLTAQPEAYGLTNVTDPCTNTDLSQLNPFPPTFLKCEKPLEYIYWDNQHPTTTVHHAIAKAAEKELSVPEPGMLPALTLIGGLYLLAKQRRIAVC